MVAQRRAEVIANSSWSAELLSAQPDLLLPPASLLGGGSSDRSDPLGAV